MTAIVGLDHVQVAAPPRCEPRARRFFAEDPFGNRVEFIGGG